MSVSQAQFDTLFPKAMITGAQYAQQQYPVVFASVTLGQGALESGFWKATPSGSNNYFGIKAVAGQSYVTAMTREVVKGRDVRLPQNFAKYGSVTDCFLAHAHLLATAGVYSAAQHDNNPKQFLIDIAKHYATDPAYQKDVQAIIDEYELTRFDIAPVKPAPVMSPHTNNLINDILFGAISGAAQGAASAALKDLT